jgi:tol-pal system protein YbgF
MTKRRVLAFLTIGAAGLLSGCAPMQGSQSRASADQDLRRLVMETRRELEDLRKDQERLRGTVEQLQYASSGRAPSAGVPAATAASAGALAGSAAPGMVPQAPVESGVAGAVDAAAAAPAVPVPEPPPASPPGAIAATDPMIAAVTGAGSGTTPGSIRADEVPTVPTELRGSGYDDGVRAFVEQQYEDSIQYFRNFIHGNSTSANADDAQYWIGEAYLRKGMYSNAIKEFNQVVLRYGSGDRAAPALLKLAQVFSKIGDQVDARLSLQKLVNRYPGTPEASEAHRMLQQMGG